MTSFADLCKELMEDIGKYHFLSHEEMLTEGPYWVLKKLRAIKKERLARAKDEVAFLKLIYLQIIHMNNPHRITERIADLEAGIQILEGTA